MTTWVNHYHALNFLSIAKCGNSIGSFFMCSNVNGFFFFFGGYSSSVRNICWLCLMITSSLSTVHKTRMLRVGSCHLFVFFSLNQLSDLWKVKVFSSNCLNHSQPLITLQIFSTEEKYIHWCVLHMRIKYIMGWFSLVYLKKNYSISTIFSRTFILSVPLYV